MKIGRWLLTGFAGLAFVAALEFGGAVAIDFLFNPWAYRNPSPLGAWSGDLSHPKGGRFKVFLDIQHDAGDSSRETPPVEGVSAVCSPGEKPFEGSIIGKAGWTGRELDLRVTAPFGTNGVASTVRCQWDDGGLTCAFDFSKHYDDARMQAILKKGGIVTEWPPVQAPMRRTARAVFETSCLPPAKP